MTIEEWVKFALQSNVVAALVVGAFGVVTLKLGLGKFRSEKWWERKSAAYIALIEALHAMEAYAKAVIAESGGEFEFSDEAKVSLHDASLAGENEIRKFNTIGPLVLSQKASMILQFLVKELDSMLPDEPIIKFHRDRLDLINAIISKLRHQAKRDLQT